MSDHRKPHRRELGFSLIELMISASLMSAIALLMVMVYSGVGQSWVSIEQRAQLNQNVRLTVSRISQELRMASQIHSPERDETGSSRLEFDRPDGEAVVAVEYKFDEEEGRVYRNGSAVAELVTAFVVDRELLVLDEDGEVVRSDVLTITIEATIGDQSHAVSQQVKLRNSH